MSDIEFFGRIKTPDNPLKDIPEDITVWEWRRLKEKQEQDRQTTLFADLTYERDIES